MKIGKSYRKRHFSEYDCTIHVSPSIIARNFDGDASRRNVQGWKSAFERPKCPGTCNSLEQKIIPRILNLRKILEKPKFGIGRGSWTLGRDSTPVCYARGLLQTSTFSKITYTFLDNLCVLVNVVNAYIQAHSPKSHILCKSVCPCQCCRLILKTCVATDI